MPGSTQFEASNSSPPVSALLRVISHRIGIPGWKSSSRSPPGGATFGSPCGGAGSLLIFGVPLLL